MLKTTWLGSDGEKVSEPAQSRSFPGSPALLLLLGLGLAALRRRRL